MKKSIDALTRQRAKELRKNLTPPEKRLWSYLQNRQVLSLHVRRQHPIGHYIADFYIENLKLVIEVDGYTHEFRYEEDIKRDIYMKERGYTVIRVSSKNIMEKIDDIIEYLRIVCKDMLSTPS